MKIRILNILLAVTSLLIMLSGCGTSGTATGGTSSAASGGQSGQIRGSLFSGTGGKGMSLSILSPSPQGLTPDENYLPTLIQGLLVENFTKYSAIEVLDRGTVYKMAAELEQYTDSQEVVNYANIVPTQYMLVGDLIKTGPNYLLRLNIADTKTGVPVAVFNSTTSRAALADFSAVIAASIDLLKQMGVTLTSAGQQSIQGASQNTKDAEIALARGVTAQRGNTIVEAMHYFSEAVYFDSSFLEAKVQIDNLSTQIVSGNIGENIRNEIQRRNAWKKLLEDAVDFYNRNPFFNIIFYTEPRMGNIDFNREIADIYFSYWFEPNAGLDAARNIVSALYKARAVVLENHSYESIDGVDQRWLRPSDVSGLFNDQLDDLVSQLMNVRLIVSAELLDENKKSLGTFRESINCFRWDDDGAVLSTNKIITDGYYPALVILYNSMGFKNITAGRISGTQALNFTGIGRRHYRFNSDEMIVNAIGSVQIKSTDKNIREYYQGKKTQGYYTSVNTSNVLFRFPIIYGEYLTKLGY